ncbi:hypothetical protein A2Z33_07275 [Candidatus Gottesmanbacteria bacterium RBG_16_52_11]|uniref:Acyltransferase 3 domain-containing protein n=1 Tax=Candidatus Gottesmanbacteria bacterium RBG_16_52_11 TaxID=1798374 RepID=A0A1F5YY82_9BACT|nr:MAG: hypothetical protein A2Z33_07275 [Candidatus Gottesmanbacteria bacterium RBG_16_52_11]
MNNTLPDEIRYSRNPALDFTRGIAVLLMVFSHTVFFLHDGSSPILNLAALAGNISVFSIFFFVSGSATYIRHLVHNRRQYGKRQYLLRILSLLTGYYAIAVISAMKSYPPESVPAMFSLIGRILIFITVPSFSEFLLPFIAVYITLPFLTPLYRKIAHSIPVALVSSAAAFVAGYLLFGLKTGSPVREYLALFAGSDGLLRFPVLQYFPVFAAGLVWGRHITDIGSGVKRVRILTGGAVLFLSLTVAALITSTFFPAAIIAPLNRWPPSLGFLTVGLGVIFTIMAVRETVPETRRISIILKAVSYLGIDSFDIYVVHMLILLAYAWMNGSVTSALLPVITGYIIVLCGSALISALNFAGSGPVRSFRVSIGHHGRYRIKRRYIAALLLAGLASGTSLLNPAGVPTVGGFISPKALIGPESPPLPDSASDSVPWFDTEFGYSRQIVITNTEPVLPLAKGEVVSVTLDHGAWVTDGKSDPAGLDLTTVYWNGSEYIPVSSVLVSPDSTEGKISLRLEHAIYPHLSDNRYFLYYGSDTRPADRIAQMSATEKSYRTVLKEERQPDLGLTADRKWLMKGYGPSQLTLKVSDRQAGEGNYSLSLTGTGGVEFPADPSGITTYSIDTAGLPAGFYAFIIAGGSGRKSRTLTFRISYPVYVSWTLDWEGWDVPDSGLDALDGLSWEFGIPYTHYFNPRIYLPGVLPPGRAQRLTEWVLRRYTGLGEEIGLHLHMHYDLVSAAGVGVRYQPHWGYRSADGYDVPSTVYEPAEFARILDYGLSLIAENGLPKPSGFRAGGWYADSGMLEVLSESGFLYDSSGHDRMLWNGQAESPWDLNPQSQPYYPSRTDQNAPADKSRLLLEIPNTAGNTNENTAAEILSVLKTVYDGNPVMKPQAVTLMTHPQWYLKEVPVAREVLKVLRQHSFTRNSGPVIFVTAGDIYNIWK